MRPFRGHAGRPSRRWCAIPKPWTSASAPSSRKSCLAPEGQSMKPPPFSYHDPATVADAVGLLSRLENAKLLAGGQSLMPMLNMRYVLPDHVIDLNRVEGLSFIRE